MNYLNNEQIRDKEAQLQYLSKEDMLLLALSAKKEKAEMAAIEKETMAALESAGEQLSLLDLEGKDYNFGEEEKVSWVWKQSDAEITAIIIRDKDDKYILPNKKVMEAQAAEGTLDPKYQVEKVVQQTFKVTSKKGGKK